MSNRRRKDELQALRDTDARVAALAAHRHPHHDLHYPGLLGRVCVQVLRVPSFEPTVAWEVREHDGAFALFRSHGPEPGEYLLTDHVRFDTPSAVLHDLIEPLHAVTIPARPRVELVAIADAVLLELHVAVSFYSSVRVSWAEGLAPPEWRPLETIIAAMLTRFEASQPGTPSLDEHARRADQR